MLTRLALYGGARPPYGSFFKAIAVIPPAPEKRTLGVQFLSRTKAVTARSRTLEVAAGDREIEI